MLSPRIYAGAKNFRMPFYQQCDAVTSVLKEQVNTFPIAAIIVFGSILGWLGPNSDVDIMVIMRDDYKQKGFTLLDMKLDLEMLLAPRLVNNIPVDLHVTSFSGFIDTSRDTAFKRSFSKSNCIVWEDGVTIGPYIVDVT